ncbi:MAG: hypothetical protein ACHQ4H_08145 [Ktedonobacterales bacterium]
MKASDESGISQARCIALTQEHRGHGVSTAAYFLGRVLVEQGLRVLVVDLTDRRGRLAGFFAHSTVRNLVLWGPPVPRPHELGALLEQGRKETAGKADVILLDVDAVLLERAGGFALGLDYVVTVVAPAESGLHAADRLAERLGLESTDARMGVMYSRVDGPAAAELPARTEQRTLPVIGHFPADYLLAGGDAYSLKGSAPSIPHDAYIHALARVAQRLTRLVPLTRQMPLVGIETHQPPRNASSAQSN